MNSIVSVFNFDDTEIRFVEGKPVANDVALALGYKDPADAIWRKVKPKNKGVCEIQTPGGVQSATVLEEAGIYQLIFGSKLSSAEKFQDWVFEEVLPSIRKTGKYSVSEIQTEQQKLTPSVEQTVTVLNALRLAMPSISMPLLDGFVLNRIQAHHPELKADINAAHSLLAATNPIPEILLTPTAIGERLGISARTVNALLTANEYQVKNPSKKKTEPAYLPTEKGKEYSSNTIATGKGNDNTSYQHTKWNESMVEIVRNLM